MYTVYLYFFNTFFFGLHSINCYNRNCFSNKTNFRRYFQIKNSPEPFVSRDRWPAKIVTIRLGMFVFPFRLAGKRLWTASTTVCPFSSFPKNVGPWTNTSSHLTSVSPAARLKTPCTRVLTGVLGIFAGYRYRVSCAIYAIPYWYIFLADKSSWNNHSYLFGLLIVIFSVTDAHRNW